MTFINVRSRGSDQSYSLVRQLTWMCSGMHLTTVALAGKINTMEIEYQIPIRYIEEDYWEDLPVE